MKSLTIALRFSRMWPLYRSSIANKEQNFNTVYVPFSVRKQFSAYAERNRQRSYICAHMCGNTFVISSENCGSVRSNLLRVNLILIIAEDVQTYDVKRMKLFAFRGCDDLLSNFRRY